MRGSELDNRVAAALESAFEELDKHCNGQPFDISEYINFIVGSILNGLCFGGQ